MEKGSPRIRRRSFTRLQRWSLGLVSCACVVLLALSQRLLTAPGAPSQQAMGGVIFGAVALFLPVLWLIFLSPYAHRTRLLGAAAICLAGILVLQVGEATEGALRVILTSAFAFIAIVLVLAWLLVFRSTTVRWRWIAGVASLLGIAILLLRLEEPTGDMIPRVRFRFSKRPDQLLEKLPEKLAREQVDLTTTSTTDFPRFLGPDGDGRVTSGVQLQTDWVKYPPKLLWRKPIGAGWSAFAIVNGHAVTMEQRDQEELVTCYNLKTGDVEWSTAIIARHENALGGIGPRSTPTIYKGRVYALGATGVLRCVDGATGKVIWSHDLLKEHKTTAEVEANTTVFWGRAASPLIVDEMVVVPVGGPDLQNCVSLAAYQPETGDLIWEGGESQVSYCSPQVVTLDGVRQIVIVNESTVAGHDIKTGKELWKFDWPGESNGAASNSQVHLLPNSRLLATKGYATGAALFQVRHSGDNWKVDEESVWKDHRVLKTKLTNVVIKDGKIYGLSDGILECVDAETGKRLWRGGRYGHGQILLVGDDLLVLGEGGELAIGKADPSGWKELGRIEALTGKTWNNPALSGNLLLVRNAEEAACYELATVSQPEKTEP
jgi:outer membrane protein assembly factor BamB